MRQFAQFLTENRITVLKDKYRDSVIARMTSMYPFRGLSHDDLVKAYGITVFPRIRNADPTENKQYLDWMLRQFLKPNRFFEDLATVKTALELFDRFKGRLETRQRDINYYTDYIAFRALMTMFEDKKTNSEIKKEEIAQYKKQIITVYEGSDAKVYIPQTWKASQFLGRGTKWCTAMKSDDEWFDHYTTGDTPLFVFLMADGRKYQYHCWDIEYMMEYDDLSAMPEEIQLCNEEDIDFKVSRLKSLMRTNAARACFTRYPQYWIAAAWYIKDAQLMKHLASLIPNFSLEGMIDVAKTLRTDYPEHAKFLASLTR